MSSEPPDRNLRAEAERINSVLEKHRDKLLSRPHVVGVAVGFQKQAGMSTQNLALVVLVDTKVAVDHLPPGDAIPATIDGILVDVQEIGPLTAQ